METWKAIDWSSGMLEVSSEGRVRSLLRGSPRILKAQEDRKGYLRVTTTINREKKTFKVHREVARAFITNVGDLPQVNHIDGNKRNNAASNLEWVTNQQNALHAIRNGLWDSVIVGARLEDERRKKPVVARCGGSVARFDSISDAERFFDSRHICDVLKGKRQRVKGWTFQYEEVTPQ